MDIAVLAYSTRLGYERFGFLAAKDYWFDNDFRQKFFKNFINLIPISRKQNPESLDLEDTFTLSKGFKGLILNSEPIDEPIVAHGPFVMNTKEEIIEAIEDYQNGKMGNLFND